MKRIEAVPLSICPWALPPGMVDGIGLRQDDLGDGNEGIALLKQELNDTGQRLRGVLGGVVEQDNGAGTDLGGHLFGDLPGGQALPIQAVHTKLERAGMTQSMSRVGKCIDNGPMEGFWGILKRERYYGKRFTSREALVNMIEDYITYYNTRRLQRGLGVLTPLEKHELYFAA